MITLTRKEAQMVLDALNAVWKIDRSTMHNKAIETLRARLSAPEPEPVAWMFTVLKLDSDTDTVEKRVLFRDFDSGQGVPLYTAPPQPELEPQEVIAKWIKTNTEHREWYICPKCSHQTPRFKDEWQGLTDEEVGMLTVFDGLHHVEVPLLAEFIRAIEAKLKEKNG